jgi:hypothetical protein
MVFMWARVLGRKTPVTAAASQRQENVDQDVLGSNMVLKISFIELPKVAGRNDVITRDFFTVDDWRDFVRDGEGGNLAGSEGVSVVSGGGNEEVLRRIAEQLNLEAIVLDGNPQAFINGKLLSVGDTLLVRDGGKTYECEVVGIEENVVVIKCEEGEISLELTKAIEVTG